MYKIAHIFSFLSLVSDLKFTEFFLKVFHIFKLFLSCFRKKAIGRWLASNKEISRSACIDGNCILAKEIGCVLYPASEDLSASGWRNISFLINF